MNYKTTIGLEIHVQLKTKSKMFCGCNNNAENVAPNSLTCPVCLGLPGVLPVANFQAIEWVVMTGLALNCNITNKSKFDRKQYFYPDLPKGYQISQFDMPFCTGGSLEIRNSKSEIRNINLTRIHLEEDAGKLIHDCENSLVDLNRAGTPLMEIVTEPEIESPAQAKQFMQELRIILRYLSVSDANMEKGHLRCDANISIAENQKSKIKNQNDNEKIEIEELGTPVEIKNINSFRMLERALIYEEKRQREVLGSGGKIEKETRGWDDSKGITFSQRSKEYAQDYRYFPEPDLPPFDVTKLLNIDAIKNNLPELPAEKRQRYTEELKIKPSDAEIISSERDIANYFEKVSKEVSPQLASSWIVNEAGIMKIPSEKLVELLKMIEKDEISGKIAKEIFTEMKKTGKSAQSIVQEKGIKQLSGEDELGQIIDKIIKDNQKPVTDIKLGKNEAVGFLVGLVMRETKGKANPEKVNKILNERLK